MGEEAYNHGSNVNPGGEALNRWGLAQLPKKEAWNPTGLENDLSRKDDDTDVRVIVSPREG